MVLFAGTFLYLGGCFLNDAFDAEFDHVHRASRPIPSGRVQSSQVWRWGLVLLAAGGLLLFLHDLLTGVLGMLLVLCIVLHNALPGWAFAPPVLLGICRFLLYAISASTAREGATGDALWCGLAAGAYATGVVFTSRQASAEGVDRYWPLLLLGLPLFLASLLNRGVYQGAAILLGVVLALWVARHLRVLWGGDTQGRETGALRLMAGLVFVDWLALAHLPRETGFFFIGFIGAALLLEKLEKHLGREVAKQNAPTT